MHMVLFINFICQINCSSKMLDTLISGGQLQNHKSLQYQGIITSRVYKTFLTHYLENYISNFECLPAEETIERELEKHLHALLTLTTYRATPDPFSPVLYSENGHCRKYEETSHCTERKIT